MSLCFFIFHELKVKTNFCCEQTDRLTYKWTKHCNKIRSSNLKKRKKKASKKIRNTKETKWQNISKTFLFPEWKFNHQGKLYEQKHSPAANTVANSKNYSKVNCFRRSKRMRVQERILLNTNSYKSIQFTSQVTLIHGNKNALNMFQFQVC